MQDIILIQRGGSHGKLYTQCVKDRIEARKREKYLKSTSGRRWMSKSVFHADVAELVYAQS